MKRDNFIKLCAGGACSCAAFGLASANLASSASPAGQTATAPQSKPDTEELEWKLNAAQERFAKLVVILGQELDEPTRKKILRRLGHECARSYDKLFAAYRGDINGFLNEIRKRWVAEAQYDEKAGTIRIVDKATSCTCPLVKPGVTPGAFCDCTLGWQQAAYSAILGKPVTVELEQSILRGDTCCSFRIRAR